MPRRCGTVSAPVPTVRRTGVPQRSFASEAVEKTLGGSRLDIGTTAPDFELYGAAGSRTRMSDLRPATRTLLIFYPKDMTSG